MENSTKVFISWSGSQSRRLAEVFHWWLPRALHSVRPYFTPEDIAKGGRWNLAIAKELETSSVGVICLTRENMFAPWIMFEAGALAKQLDDSLVCPILFDLDPSDIEGPLIQFQAATFGEHEIHKLFEKINSQLEGAALDERVLDEVYDMWWPKLNQRVSEVLKDTKPQKETELRDDREILEEILELARSSRLRSDEPLPDLMLADLVEAYGELLEAADGQDIVRPIFNSFQDMSLRLERTLRAAARLSGQYKAALKAFDTIDADAFRNMEPKDRFEIDSTDGNYGAQ